MTNVKAAPLTLKGRIVRFGILSLLMAISFTLGAAVTAIVAARMFLPIAAAGLVGIASSGATAVINALHTGDSQTRETALTGLKQSLETHGQTPIDPQIASWILPALEQCMTDQDPEVVALAREVKAIVQDGTVNPSK